jgi:hypothetical protein
MASEPIADHDRPTSSLTATPTAAPRPRRLSLFGAPAAVLGPFMRETSQLRQSLVAAIASLVALVGEPVDPSACQAEPAAAPPAATPSQRAKPAIGTGLDWQTSGDRLIAICRLGESFTSLRDLADPVGCSEDLIRTAIKQDVGLRAWATDSKRTRRTAPAAIGLKRTIHRTPQRREQAPELAAAEAEEAGDTDVLELHDQARAATRANPILNRQASAPLYIESASLFGVT